MNEPWRTVLVFALGLWVGALAVGILATAILFRRLGRDAAWPSYRQLAPLVDLVGTWAGTIAAAALLLGRQGYGFFWAAALLLVALMVTACLYDRAVLMPSLDAAWKRLAAGTEAAKWREDWAFLWRMAGWARAGTLVAGTAALGCVLASPA